MTSYGRILVDRLHQAARPLWLPRPELQRGRFEGVLLVPTAAYHVCELAPLAAALAAFNIEATFLTTRAAPRQVSGSLGKQGGRPLYAWPRSFGLVPSFSAVVVMNDWGPTRKLIELARARGVPSFAKVEGVQDFNDVDTGQIRRPYRHADIVLGQGRNDVAELPEADVRIVGSERLEAIWRKPERAHWNSAPVAVINSNFTYGVLPGIRHRWLKEALRAVRAAGCSPIISQHPAEDPLPSRYPTSSISMSRLLAEKADLLISRFSTVPFEAMARGVPFIYFNPHGERVPIFRRSDPAFIWAETESQLQGAIIESLTWRDCYRDRAASFFMKQVDMREDCNPAQRTAAEVASAVR